MGCRLRIYPFFKQGYIIERDRMGSIKGEFEKGR